VESPVLAGPVGASIEDGYFRAGPDNALPSLRTIEVRGGTLIVTDDGPELTVELGDAWTGAGPVVTGAATEDGRLHADLIFVETPHRLHVVLDPATSAFEARWETEPLHGRSLSETRSPTVR
jgi:hypothetical protein